ncbi:hypothetical protein TM239_24000 [Bradyrhizobium sp. TM239]|nr:hypothetical protein TM233_20270 [Bradyrhizobium sp. TM233]GMP00082.1 hypothetical protein TM239_24000 [Bradyrhizobium sp. TM239]
MPGLVPGIHVLRSAWLGVDGRDMPDQDAVKALALKLSSHMRLPGRKRGEAKDSMT